MLTIRKEQMDVLNGYMLRGFIHRTLNQIAKKFPNDCARLKDSGVRELIQKGIEKGARHGIDTELTVAALIELMVEFGPDFEAQPNQSWAAKTLNHPTLSGRAKMESLCRRLKGRGMED
jgi:hypothetical protein